MFDSQLFVIELATLSRSELCCEHFGMFLCAPPSHNPSIVHEHEVRKRARHRAESICGTCRSSSLASLAPGTCRWRNCALRGMQHTACSQGTLQQVNTGALAHVSFSTLARWSCISSVPAADPQAWLAAACMYHRGCTIACNGAIVTGACERCRLRHGVRLVSGV